MSREEKIGIARFVSCIFFAVFIILQSQGGNEQ